MKKVAKKKDKALDTKNSKREKDSSFDSQEDEPKPKEKKPMTMMSKVSIFLLRRFRIMNHQNSNHHFCARGQKALLCYYLKLA